MDAVTRTVQTMDLPLGPGRQTLRLILHHDEHGTPEALTLAVGFGGCDGTTFSRPGWGDPLLTLPADVLPRLVDALDSLAEKREKLDRRADP